jgi:hypothetical protein
VIKDTISHLTLKDEIRKEGSGILVVSAYRTLHNVYILNEIQGEKFYMGKTYESWLWHKRMGHINFDNMVKINTKQELRETPNIVKPSNTLCKQCQHGKLTRISFKSKEYSTTNLM